MIGGFYQHVHNRALAVGHEALDPQLLSLFGVTTRVRYGVQESSIDPILSFRDETLIEESLAGFGEATYAVTERIKLIGGARVAKETFSFDACQYGTVNGTNVCTTANGLLTSGRQKASPVLPKVGVSFQVTNKDLIYFTASKGYRGGGVNSAIPQNAACNASLAALGGSRPETFAPDYVASYELGAKLSMFGGRARFNASAYRLDWSHIQLSIALPGCLGFSYVDNVGSARSQGGELSATLNPVEGVTAEINLAYTDAKYTETTLGSPNPTTGARATLVNAGDELPIAPYTVSVGLQYEFRILGDRSVYVRGDGLYASKFHKTFGPGAVGYSPDVYDQGDTTMINVRAGVKLDHYDVSLFVKNLLNSQEITNQSPSNGRGGCANAACAAPQTTRYNNYFSTFRPRQIGVTASARF